LDPAAKLLIAAFTTTTAILAFCAYSKKECFFSRYKKNVVLQVFTEPELKLIGSMLNLIYMLNQVRT
jgi:hypothetical protein